MGNLRRYYYENKNTIWKRILMIASILLLIHGINAYIRYSSINNNSTSNENTTNKIEQTNKKENIIISSNKSGVTGESVNTTILEKDTQIIEKFVNYCNNKKIEEAYKLLSSSCKEELYKTQEDFISKYINNIFANGSTKIAKIENWVEDIYKVNFAEDVMSTGKINGDSKQDYMTIVREDGERKINISSFIEKKEMKKNITSNDIEFTVIGKKVYMDYEEYTINVVNKSDNTIILDTKESTKSIFIEDNKEIKYYSYSHEILDSLIKINSGAARQLKIKFSKSYSSTRKTQSIVFSDVVLNYDEYISGNNEKEKIKIEL